MSTDDVDVPPFTAVHYVPTDDGRWSVSISDFDLRGPIADTAVPVNVPSIYPLNQIAIDTEGQRVYGVTTHMVGKIVPATGNFVEIEIDPALPELSWPSGIAFDSHNRKLVVVARSGVYFFDPASGEWTHTPKFGGLDLLSLTYDESEQVFYGLVSGFGRDFVDKIATINADGAVISTMLLSEGLPTASLPAGRVQLMMSPKELIILVSSYRSRRGSDEDVAASKIYLVDLQTGDIGLVESPSSI